jgi:hypothetical protein
MKAAKPNDDPLCGAVIAANAASWYAMGFFTARKARKGSNPNYQ